MRFTAIDTSAWEELKESIVELPTASTSTSLHLPSCPTYCTMGTCAEY